MPYSPGHSPLHCMSVFLLLAIVGRTEREEGFGNLKANGILLLNWAPASLNLAPLIVVTRKTEAKGAAWTTV